VPRELDGGGGLVLRPILLYIEAVIPRPIYHTLEAFAGVGLWGFHLLNQGLTEFVTFSEINEEAVMRIRNTSAENKLEDRTKVHLGDNLIGLEAPEDGFNLVIASPPSYHSIDRDHTLYSKMQNDIRAVDRHWRLHDTFYKRIGRLMADDGNCLVLEVEPDKKIVELYRQVYDRREFSLLDMYPSWLDSAGLVLKNIHTLIPSAPTTHGSISNTEVEVVIMHSAKQGEKNG
jgi:tRNA1(Val) A37 N6-methylase TrmN6